jgi:hypothetical protein
MTLKDSLARPTVFLDNSKIVKGLENCVDGAVPILIDELDEGMVRREVRAKVVVDQHLGE